MSDWTTLGALRPGAVFETETGCLYVKGYSEVPYCLALVSGISCTFPKPTSVREIDVPGLAARVKELEGILSDVHHDGGIRVGQEAERGAILAGMMHEDYRLIAGWIRSRGPVREPLPMDVLHAANEKLRAALWEIAEREVHFGTSAATRMQKIAREALGETP